MLIEAALQLAVAALALRVHGTETISMWLEDLITSFGNYPLSIFPATVRILFTYILPIAFIGYLPATVILGVHDEASIQPLLGWASPLVGVSLFALCLRLWRLGLRHYQGNSA